MNIHFLLFTTAVNGRKQIPYRVRNVGEIIKEYFSTSNQPFAVAFRKWKVGENKKKEVINE